ncbi:MAG: alpha/beta fold hydrolase [Acidobacteriota bacterium]
MTSFSPIPFRIESPRSFGGAIEGLIQRSGKPGRRPAVLVCHGFKGFMEWGFFPPLADLLADRGFTVVRFNYSGSGMRPGEDRVFDLEAFRGNTFSLELEETLLMLSALEGLDPEHIDPDRIALMGHSRGGGAAILAAADEAWRERLGALVTWSAVATFDRYGTGAREKWREDGALEIANARTGQSLQLGLELLEDVEKNGERLDLESAASRRRAPWLLVHGRRDETVPLEEAETLFAAAQRDRAADSLALEVVDEGSHTFGSRHPFAGPTREIIQAMNATQVWLRRHLRV